MEIQCVPGRAARSASMCSKTRVRPALAMWGSTPGVVTTRDYSYERIGGGEAISLVPRDEKSGNAAGTMVKCAP